MPNTIITQAGIDYITGAHEAGLLVAVKYWVPVYDWRIDPDIQIDNTPFSSISDVATDAVSLSEPYGEILWFKGSDHYKMSDETSFVYILSGYGAGEIVDGKEVQDTVQAVGPVSINLSASSETTLTSYYKSRSFSTSSTNRWKGDPALHTSAYGYNPDQSTDKTKFFKVNDYYQISETGVNAMRGNFRCDFTQDIGSVKFNKIVLYAVKYEDGVETTDAPGYFAEAYLTAPVRKSVFGDGYNEVTIDCQIEVSAKGGGNWDDIFYGSSADYLAKVKNGLHSNEKISIGTFERTDSEPKAVVEIGKTITSAGAIEDILQIKIHSNKNVDVYKSWFGIKGSTQAYAGYNLILSGSNNYPYTSNYTTISPRSRILLGDLSYPFEKITTSGGYFTNPLYAPYRTHLYQAGFGDYLMRFVDSGTSAVVNSVYGADLVRDGSDLIIQTKDDNIYILAGGKNYANIAAGDNPGLRHRYNIADVAAINPLSSTSNWVWSATNNIVARGGNKVFGPLELNYVPRFNNATHGATAKDFGILSTKKKYMSVMSGLLLSYSDYLSQYDYMLYEDVNNTTNWSPLGTYIDSNSILFIQAGSVKVWGDILPQYKEINSTSYYEKKCFNLGSSLSKFYKMYGERINIDIDIPKATVGSVNEITTADPSWFYGLNIIRSRTRGVSSVTSETTIYPSLLDTIKIGTEAYPISEINAETVNVPGTFIADSNGVFGTSISATDFIAYTSCKSTAQYTSIDAAGAEHGLKWYIYEGTLVYPYVAPTSVLIMGASKVIGFTTIYNSSTGIWTRLADGIAYCEISGGSVRLYFLTTSAAYNGKSVKVIIYYQ